jgi:hypothetical protein
VAKGKEMEINGPVKLYKMIVECVFNNQKREGSEGFYVGNQYLCSP